MNFKRVAPTFWATVALLGLAAATMTVKAQQPQFSRDQLIGTAREIMTTARYCALITTGNQGRANARTMDAFAPDGDMIVWLATNPLSRKVAEIRRHPDVTLYYFDRDNQAYVTLYGVARLVNDRNDKARHWKDDWKTFYPDRDRSYLLIEVRPVKLEVVNVKAGVVGTSRGWDPPVVEFPRPAAKAPH
jgi:general stress protein 26